MYEDFCPDTHLREQHAQAPYAQTSRYQQNHNAPIIGDRIMLAAQQGGQQQHRHIAGDVAPGRRVV